MLRNIDDLTYNISTSISIEWPNYLLYYIKEARLIFLANGICSASLIKYRMLLSTFGWLINKQLILEVYFQLRKFLKRCF